MSKIHSYVRGAYNKPDMSSSFYENIGIDSWALTYIFIILLYDLNESIILFRCFCFEYFRLNLLVVLVLFIPLRLKDWLLLGFIGLSLYLKGIYQSYDLWIYGKGIERWIPSGTFQNSFYFQSSLLGNSLWFLL